MVSRLKARPTMTWAAVIVTVLIFALCLWLEFQRLTIKPWPPTTFGDAVSEFKYGSIGAEVNGFPYAIWRELPTIFKDEMPGGWRHFGFQYEPGQQLPIGISVRRTGVERVGFNCATCHTARIRVGDTDRLILGAPAEQLDLQAYLLFVLKAARDPRLTADAVIASAAENGRPMDWLDQQVLRHAVFPRIAAATAALGDSLAWMSAKTLHGPGRTDAANIWRQRWGMRPISDANVGTVDFPSVWNQQIRRSGWFHWDGNNNSLTERNYSAALAGGATDWLLDRRAIGKISLWLETLLPPAFPLPLDRDEVARGKTVFVVAGCAACHGPGGRVGQVTDIDVVGTDPERANIFSAEMVARFHEVGRAYSWRFSHYRSTHGYANVPLDGIWARAPYLHNGSVPTLAALLSPSDARPKFFLRGCATYDVERVGYACSTGVAFDTTKVGNSNRGHLYGIGMSPADKAALLAYLKSL